MMKRLQKFKKVKLSIGQPNAHHPDGPIREYDMTVRELLRFEEKKLIPALEDIKAGSASLNPGKKQCTWCDARDHCEANLKHLEKETGIDFVKFVKPAKRYRKRQNIIKTLTVEQRLALMENKERIEGLLKLNETSLMRDCEREGSIGEYVIKQGSGHRALLEQKAFRAVCRKFNVPVTFLEYIPPKKTMNLGEIETFLRNERGWKPEKIDRFMDAATTKPPGAKKLVKRTDTSETDFAHLGQTKRRYRRK
jgi:hypothetical protein